MGRRDGFPDATRLTPTLWRGLAVQRPEQGPKLLVLIAVALTGLTLGAPARAQTPQPLARYLPQKDLIALIEFDGLDAHTAVWKKTATYRLLNETTLGKLLEDLAAQGFEKAFARSPMPNKPTGTQFVKLVETVLKNGFAVSVNGQIPAEPKLVAVVRGGGRGELRAFLEPLLKSAARPGSKDEARRGRTLHDLDQGFWWFEKDDLVLTSPPATLPNEVFDLSEGKGSSAVAHPLRVELRKTEDGFRPLMIAFVDASKLPTLPPQAVEMGLDGVKRADFRFGFQDDAVMSVLRIVAPKPRKGFLSYLDQPTFDKTSLPPLPKSLTGFGVVSLNIDQLYSLVMSLRASGAPNAAQQQADLERVFQQSTGVRLREDLLKHVGPKVAVFARPIPGAAPIAPLPVALPEVTVLAQIDDATSFGKTLDQLVAAVSRGMQNPPGAPGGRPGPQVVKLPGARPGYAVNGIPAPGMTPTIYVTKGFLVVSSTKEGAELAASAVEKPGDRWVATGPFKTITDRLPKSMFLLGVSDPRSSLPAFVTGLPGIVTQVQGAVGQARNAGGRPGAAASAPIRIDTKLIPTADAMTQRLFPNFTALTVDDQSVRYVARSSVPGLGSPASSGIAIALLLPAVQAAREAARRAQCTNNMKQIGLAMHNYHAVNNALPGSAITSKAGKPLLSWRVAILPFLEQGELYNQFHLDEPWDSPHNKGLIEKMPATYTCPSDKLQEKGLTSYRVFSGPGTAFEGTKGHGMQEFLDGTSNTIAVVESKDAVPWTKPDDLPFDPKPNAQLLMPGSNHPGGFNTLFVDGSVRFIKFSINVAVLRALVTRNGGEIIQADAY
jgi:prepilin-type processing-associated H-X9-DG protein